MGDWIIHICKSKIGKDDIIVLVSSGFFFYIYQYTKEDNEWERITNRSQYYEKRLNYVSEMHDNTILIGSNNLYVLFTPLYGNKFI